MHVFYKVQKFHLHLFEIFSSRYVSHYPDDDKVTRVHLLYLLVKSLAPRIAARKRMGMDNLLLPPHPYPRLQPAS